MLVFKNEDEKNGYFMAVNDIKELLLRIEKEAIQR